MMAMKPLVDKGLRRMAGYAWLALVLPLVLLALQGCAGLPLTWRSEMPEVTHMPLAGALPKPVAPRGFALVLSGGAARGFAHIGVIKVLEEAGLRPDLIVGSSAGSIVATLYASGMSVRELEGAARDADGAMVGDTNWLRLIRLQALGVVAGNALHRFVAQHTGGKRFEEMVIPLAVVATNLSSGAATAFTRGDASHAVHASSAIPGVFEPVEIGGWLYADGGLSSPLPVATARRLGARLVIAVDVVYPPADSPPPLTALDVMFQTFLVQTYRLKEHEVAQADLVIAPPIPVTGGQYGFKDRDMLIAAGEAAARTALPQMRALLAALEQKTQQPLSRKGLVGAGFQ